MALIAMNAVYCNISAKFVAESLDDRVIFNAVLSAFVAGAPDDTTTYTPVDKTVTWEEVKRQDVKVKKYGKKAGYILPNGKKAHFYKVWGTVTPSFAARLVPATGVDAGK